MGLELGRLVREARLRLGLTQQEVAEGIVSAAFLSMVESGRREPSPEVLLQLAARLQIDPHAPAPGSGVAGLIALRTAVMRARGLVEAGAFAQALGDLDAAIAMLAGRDEPELRCDLHYWRGRALEGVGNLDAAIRELIIATEIAASRGEVARELEMGIDLIRCLKLRGDLNAALDRTRQLEARLPIGLEGSALHGKLVATVLGLHLLRGDQATAQLLADRARAAFGPGAHVAGKAPVMWNASLIAEANGDPEGALVLASEAARLMDTGVEDAVLGRLHTAIAWLYTRTTPPDLEGARAELLAARESFGDAATSQDRAALDLEESRLQWLHGDYRGALALIESALATLAEGAPGVQLGAAHLLAARTHASLLQIEESRRHFHAAQQVLATTGASRANSLAWRELGDVYVELGFSDDAMAAYRQALAEAGLPPSPTGSASTTPSQERPN